MRTADPRRESFKRLCLEVVVFLALVAAVFGALAAWAQATDVLTPAPLEINPANTALVVLDGIKNGQWWLVAGGVVSLLTWALRNGVLKRLPWPAAVKWLNDHPAVGFMTPFALSAIGGVVTAFASGVPFTWGSLIGEILKVGVTAVGAFVGMRTISESRDFGKAEAAKVTTREQSNEEILRP